MMNRLWICVPLVIVGLSGCKEKQPAQAPESAPVVAGGDPQPAPAVVRLSAAERAEIHGFSRYLPQDAELVFTVQHGTKVASRIMASQWFRVLTGAEAGDAEAIEQGLLDGEPMGVAALMGKEFTLALGKGGCRQLGQWMLLNRRSNYFKARSLVEALAASTSGDEGFSWMQAIMAGDERTMLQTFTGDEAVPDGYPAGLDLLEDLQLPPLYLAFRVGGESRDAVAQQIAATLQMMTGMVGSAAQPIEKKQGEAAFTGYKLAGSFFADEIKGNRQDLEEGGMSREDVDRLLTIIAAKSVTLMSGVVGEYVVIFMGSSEGDLKLEEDVGQSLVAGPALAYADAFKDKELVATVFADERAVTDMAPFTSVALGDLAAGLHDGLASTDKLGDTRNLQTMLQMVGERENLLLGLAKPGGTGVLAYLEDGLKVEAFGGTDNGMMAWNASNRLAGLGAPDDVALFVNYTTDALYDVKARAYIEALMETVYAGAMKFAELPVGGEELAQFKGAAVMFDAKFRTDLVDLWDAMNNGFGGGLGRERAWIVDLKGEAPALPGMPQALVEEAKFPRISVVAPVVDRSHLAASWGKMNTSLAGLLLSVGELGGLQMPMQKPMSSEKDGFTSWFMAVPFMNDDFVPSVTVDDAWFAASTSRNQAVDLLKQAAAGGGDGNGFRMDVNFKTLETYVDDSLAQLTKHMADKGIPAADLETWTKYAQALDALDALHVWIRRDAGELRTSMHFKTR